jgi:hypothetical protein
LEAHGYGHAASMSGVYVALFKGSLLPPPPVKNSVCPTEFRQQPLAFPCFPVTAASPLLSESKGVAEYTRKLDLVTRIYRGFRVKHENVILFITPIRTVRPSLSKFLRKSRNMLSSIVPKFYHIENKCRN